MCWWYYINSYFASQVSGLSNVLSKYHIRIEGSLQTKIYTSLSAWTCKFKILSPFWARRKLSFSFLLKIIIMGKMIYFKRIGSHSIFGISHPRNPFCLGEILHNGLREREKKKKTLKYLRPEVN